MLLVLVVVTGFLFIVLIKSALNSGHCGKDESGMYVYF